MTDTHKEIATINSHARKAGLPTYTQLAKALCGLMDYTGGWDSPNSHPCGKAAAIVDMLPEWLRGES